MAQVFHDVKKLREELRWPQGERQVLVTGIVLFFDSVTDVRCVNLLPRFRSRERAMLYSVCTMKDTEWTNYTILTFCVKKFDVRTALGSFTTFNATLDHWVVVFETLLTTIRAARALRTEEGSSRDTVVASGPI